LTQQVPEDVLNEKHCASFHELELRDSNQLRESQKSSQEGMPSMLLINSENVSNDEEYARAEMDRDEVDSGRNSFSNTRDKNRLLDKYNKLRAKNYKQIE